MEMRENEHLRETLDMKYQKLKYLGQLNQEFIEQNYQASILGIHPPTYDKGFEKKLIESFQKFWLNAFNS